MAVLVILAVLSMATVTLTQAETTCGNHGNCYNVGELHLDMDIDDDTVSVRWGVNSTEFIYGFKVLIRDSEGYVYKSPTLNKHADSMEVTAKLDGEDVRLCVVVLLNETLAITETCEKIEINDLQMVVGILAGVVFLVPCIIAITYIIFKDRQVLKTLQDDPCETKILIMPVSDLEEIVIDDEIPETSKASTGKVNKCFEGDTGSMKSENKTVLTEKSVSIKTSEAEVAGSKLDTSESEMVSLTVMKENGEKQSEVDSKTVETKTEKTDAEKKSDGDTGSMKAEKAVLPGKPVSINISEPEVVSFKVNTSESEMVSLTVMNENGEKLNTVDAKTVGTKSEKTDAEKKPAGKSSVFSIRL